MPDSLQTWGHHSQRRGTNASPAQQGGEQSQRKSSLHISWRYQSTMRCLACGTASHSLPAGVFYFLTPPGSITLQQGGKPGCCAEIKSGQVALSSCGQRALGEPQAQAGNPSEPFLPDGVVLHQGNTRESPCNRATDSKWIYHHQPCCN